MTGAIPVRIGSIVQEAPLVKRFRLEPLDGRLPDFSGGAHVVVTMLDGARSRRNAYSLVNPPGDPDRYEIAVRRVADGRGGSIFLHDRVRVGDILTVTPPANLFPLDWRARRHLLIAGGIGITPFVAMTAQLAALGAAFELHYAMRSPLAGAFADRLQQLHGDAVHLYAGSHGERLPIARLIADQPLGTHLYVCGPARLIDEVRTTALTAGWPEAHVHAERFDGARPGAPFTARLARSGRRIAIETDESLLEALEREGVAIDSLCRGGACGRCVTSVVACDGTIEHADHYLSAADKASGRLILPCVSRVRGDGLVLDL